MGIFERAINQRIIPKEAAKARPMLRTRELLVLKAVVPVEKTQGKMKRRPKKISKKASSVAGMGVRPVSFAAKVK
jgi:hypothetical protein